MTWSLTQLVGDHLDQARRASRRRSVQTMHGGPAQAFRQIMIALLAGERLDQSEHPGRATVQVLHGRVRLAAGGSMSEGAVGDLLIPSAAMDRLEAVEDAVVLLTVAARPRQTASEPGA